MYKIYIDTTERYKNSVRLFKAGAEIAQKNGDIDVVNAVAGILKENKLTPAQMEIYDVNKGPGSFTGIKIGVTIANVLNWALGKKKISELVVPDYGREPNITVL